MSCRSCLGTSGAARPVSAATDAASMTLRMSGSVAASAGTRGGKAGQQIVASLTSTSGCSEASGGFTGGLRARTPVCAAGTGAGGLLRALLDLLWRRGATWCRSRPLEQLGVGVPYALGLADSAGAHPDILRRALIRPAPALGGMVALTSLVRIRTRSCQGSGCAPGSAASTSCTVCREVQEENDQVGGPHAPASPPTPAVSARLRGPVGA